MMALDFSKIKQAFEKRKDRISSLKTSGTNAFRAFGGEKEGIPGITIDIYDKTAIVNLYEDKFRGSGSELKEIEQILKDLYSIGEIYIKNFTADRSNIVLKEGNPNKTILALENHLKFEIHPDDGLSVGLFLDQRLNRKKVAEENHRGKLLNLFSYTCGFSIYAAFNGAPTVSVDVSKKYLEWGKRNFSLNAFPLENHKFIQEDASLYLERLVKREERFDTIVLDPPSFGRSEKKVFSIEKDLGTLVENSLKILKNNGTLFLSCNYQKWKTAELKTLVTRNKLNAKIEIEKADFDFQLEENPLSAIFIKI